MAADKTPPPSEPNDDITLISLLGHRTRFPASALKHIATGDGFWQFYFCVVLVMAIDKQIDPIDMLMENFDFGTAFVTIVGMVATAWMVLYFWFVVIGFLHRRRIIRSFYCPIIVFSLLVTGQTFGRTITSLLVEDLDMPPFWSDAVLRDMILLLVFEYIWIRYVSVNFGQQYQAPSDVRTLPLETSSEPLVSATFATATPPSAAEQVGVVSAVLQTDSLPACPEAYALNRVGIEVNLSALLYVRSEQHRLRFHFIDDELVVRARLRDLSEDLGTDFGIQINRSTWAYFKAVERFEKEVGHGYVWFADGRREKVTDARLIAFDMAYQNYKSRLDATAQ